jgi:hypothetical protein
LLAFTERLIALAAAPICLEISRRKRCPADDSSSDRFVGVVVLAEVAGMAGGSRMS